MTGLRATDWLSLVANVIGVSLGFAAFWVTFEPPSGSTRIILLWAIGALSVTLIVCAIWQVQENVKARAEAEEKERRQEARDRKADGVQLDVIERFDDLAASDDARERTSRRAQSALREEALQLANDVEKYLAERLENAPSGVLDAATLAAHNAWHSENDHIYAARYAGRVKRAANAMALCGVADDFLIAQANQRYPHQHSTWTIYVMPGLLRKAAEKL